MEDQELMSDKHSRARQADVEGSHVTDRLAAMDEDNDGCESDNDNDVKPEFGIKRIRSLLCHRNPLTFSLASALSILTQVTVIVFVITQLTSLEREFGFSTTQMGQLMSANEVGYLCFVLPGSYMASKIHVPRALAVTAFCVGLAAFMTGLPHFIFQRAEDAVLGSNNISSISAVTSAENILPAFCGVMSDDRCSAVKGGADNISSLSPDGDQSPKAEAVYSHRAFPVFVYILVCQVLRGAMGAPRFPLFVEYVETNSKKSETGFYMGTVMSITMLGPAIAFIGGGAISQLHVSLQPTDLTPEHPEWVGAWWLGFMLFGALAAVAPVFVWGFPRSLTNAASSTHDSHRRPSARRPSSTVRVTLGVLNVGKGFLLAIMRILLNPVLMFLILASCLSAFSMNATYLYMPKYLENQFQVPAWKANYIMGGAELGMGTTGFFLGGYLTRWLKPTIRLLYKTYLGVYLCSVLLVVALMFVGCPQPHLTGAPGTSVSTSNNSCILSCACPEEVFPVCDRETNENYFSPCHAGCASLEDGVYLNCSCAASGQVHPGLCASDCYSVYIYAVLFFVLLFLLSFVGPVGYLLMVRSVPTSQTGLAMGTSGFASAIVGFLIGPMVFGGMIDGVCEHWKTPCGVKGQCSVYNNHRFRTNLHLYAITAMSLSFIAVIVSFVVCRFCTRPPQEEEAPVSKLEDKATKHGRPGKKDAGGKKQLLGNDEGNVQLKRDCIRQEVSSVQANDTAAATDHADRGPRLPECKEENPTKDTCGELFCDETTGQEEKPGEALLSDNTDDKLSPCDKEKVQLLTFTDKSTLQISA